MVQSVRFLAEFNLLLIILILNNLQIILQFQMKHFIIKNIKDIMQIIYKFFLIHNLIKIIIWNLKVI